MKSFFSQAAARFNANTPLFFKKITKIGVGFGATGTALVAPSASPHIHMPAILVTIGGYLIVAGIVAGAVAKLTCSDPENLPKV